MRGRGTRDRGHGERLVLLSLVPCLLSSCAKNADPASVWIDVARLAPTAVPARVAPSLRRPPAPLASRSASLPARPATKLVAEVGIDGAQLAREVDEAQASSLARLRKRLAQVYAREGDRFARAQFRLLGDPYRTAIEFYYPDYRKAFEAYAERRLVPAARLAFIVGPKDPNPEDKPVETEALTPLGRLLAVRASETRKTLRALDREFDGVVMALLENVATMGDASKAATLAAVARNREALNRQAMAQAAFPIGPSGEEAITLSLARKGIATVPAVPARKVVLPAIPAPAPAPRVESPQALADARARLLGEARIWAAGQGLRLDPKGRDATSEFLRWKTLRAGASPNSPKPSGAPSTVPRTTG